MAYKVDLKTSPPGRTESDRPSSLLSVRPFAAPKSTQLRYQVRNASPQAAQVPSASAGTGAAVQRTIASVSYTADQVTRSAVGDQVGRGGVGGVSHSEQSAWGRAKDAITGILGRGNKHVDVEFSVDTTICSGCVPWFESDVYDALESATEDNGSSFKLTVEVNGQRVEVKGTNTIWSPEVADEHSYDRLSAMDRSMTFLRENRSETGRKNDEAQSPHVVEQVESLDALLQGYEYSGLTLEAIGEAFEAANARVVTHFKDIYDEEEAEETVEDYLETISFSAIVSSGGLSIPAIPAADTLEKSVEKWLQLLQERLLDWLKPEVEDHFMAYEAREEGWVHPHHR